MLPSLVKRLFNRPKRSDNRPLAQFFFADEEVTRITTELGALDLRKDPQKYLLLLNQLRLSQDQMLRSIELVMEDFIAGQRHSRDYYVKFPDEIRQENLGVQLWFAAECLSAGSFLEVRESEGLLLRPLAEQLLRSLEEVRRHLREQSLSGLQGCSGALRQALLRYDSIFAQFELSYISTVMPVKSAEELQRQQEIVVLFCETVERALKLGYINQELIDGYEPLVMFSIPRLAIICGLLIFPDGPLNLQRGSEGLSNLFSPFYTLLQKIRDLLQVLTKEELYILERSLCSAESSGFLCSSPPASKDLQLGSGVEAPKDCVGTGQVPDSSRCACPNCWTSPFQQNPQPFPGRHPTVVPFSQGVVSGLGCPGQVDDLFPGTGSAQPGLLRPGHSQLPLGDSVASAAMCFTCQAPSRRSDAQPGQQTSFAPSLPALASQDFNCHHVPAEPGLRAAGMDGHEPQLRWRHSVRAQDWHSRQLCAGTVSQCPGRSIKRLQQRGRQAGGRDSRRADLRARYSSSSDMIHRLFVCISGVADQLQTNFASDMRAILKCVFELIISRDDPESKEIQTKATKDKSPQSEYPNSAREECELCEELSSGRSRRGDPGAVPVWVPDEACSHCTACKVPFTLLRRRHHCRNCGKIFCARCSPKEALLPQLGHVQPVRVCNHCFDVHIVGETTQL